MTVSASSTASRSVSRSSTASESGHLRRRAARSPPHVGGRRADRRHDARRRWRRAARADLTWFRRERGAARRDAPGGARHRSRAPRRRRPRDQAAPGAHPRRNRPIGLRPDTPAADDPSGGDRGMTTPLETRPEWAAVIVEHAAEERTYCNRFIVISQV